MMYSITLYSYLYIRPGSKPGSVHKYILESWRAMENYLYLIHMSHFLQALRDSLLNFKWLHLHISKIVQTSILSIQNW